MFDITTSNHVFAHPRSYSMGSLKSASHFSRSTNGKCDNILLIPSKTSKFQSFHETKQKPQKSKDSWIQWLKPIVKFVSLGRKKLCQIWNMYKAKLLTKIRYLRTVPGIILIAALVTASLNLWFNEADVPVLVGAACAIVISLVIISIEYSSNVGASVLSFLACLWWGLLLGYATFGSSFYRTWQFGDRDRLMNMLLMSSAAFKCCCDFLDRFCEDIQYRSTFLLHSEMGYLLGFLVGGALFLSTGNDVGLLLIVIASGFVLFNLRVKCTLAFFHLFLFIAVASIAVFDNLITKINSFALVCFYTRLFVPSVLDFYFSPLSALERWSCSLELSCSKHFLMTTIFFLIEVVFALLAAYAIVLHPEYELVFVIPVVTTTGALWLCTHVAYITTEIALARKLNECVDFYQKLPSTSAGTNLSHVMSSKGVRLLCFVGQQTVACALLSTLLYGAVSWRREDPVYPSLLLIVVGLECASFGRIRELAVKLGGTCASYALITPTTVANNNAPVTILPADSLKHQNDRATLLITSMHRFFALYLIEILGCDYSTTGLGFGMVEEKIKILFAKRTKAGSGDGARFDTYLFYFSGLTTDDGSLVLGDGASLSPDHLIDMWRESCRDEKDMTSSRLLLILDIERSAPWLKAVRGLKEEYVAIQSWTTLPQPRKDVEEGLVQYSPGSFTSKWVQWNYDVTNGISSSVNAWSGDETDKTLPMYVVSRRWTDFALRVPAMDERELSCHWRVNYFFLCRPCLSVSASCARRLRLVRLLGAPGRRYRRLKMRWFPPAVLDTGHGFKLIRSK